MSTVREHLSRVCKACGHPMGVHSMVRAEAGGWKPQCCCLVLMVAHFDMYLPPSPPSFKVDLEENRRRNEERKRFAQGRAPRRMKCECVCFEYGEDHVTVIKR